MKIVEIAWVDSHSLSADWYPKETVDNFGTLPVNKSVGYVYGVTDAHILIVNHYTSEEMYHGAFAIPREAIKWVRFL